MTARLTPEREAEIAEHLAATKNWSRGNLAARDLLAELYAERAEKALLRRKITSLRKLQEQDDTEYAQAIAERDRARTALREACDQIVALKSAHAEAGVVSEALHRRLTDEQLAGSALYAAMTMPTTPEQRQAALDRFTAVARQVASEATR